MTGIIQEMQRVVSEVVGDDGVAAKAVHALIKAFGSDRIYVPCNNYQQRNADIMALHSAGADIKALARKYSLSERTIYRIVSTAHSPVR